MTPNRDDLSALADRIEKASAAEQRAMLEAAWDAANTGPKAPGDVFAFEALLDAAARAHDEKSRDAAFAGAAMFLVPEGWDWSVGTEQNGQGGHAYLRHIQIRTRESEADAVTPALALTAACLRAIAASLGDGL